MRSYILDLNISPEDWRRYYAGQATGVVAVARSGETIRFAARNLRAHVSRDGIHGVFRLSTDDENRFVALERLPAAGDADGH